MIMVSSTDRPTPRKDLLDRIPLRALVIAAVALMLIMGAAGLFLGNRGQSAQEEGDIAKDQLQTAERQVEAGVQLAEANLEYCIDPTVLAALKKGGYDTEVCRLAVVVQSQGEPGKRGERGPGPTDEQIGSAVEQYFREHPLPEGKSPTIAQIAQVVGDYLRANPPEPGRPPTPEEVATATATYLAANIELFRGEPGKTGEKGPPPSAEDVRAAVTAYCSEDSRCRGPQGPQGIGITGTMLTRDSQGVCTLFFNHENPANGQVTQSSVQVNDELCSTPPTSSPPTSSPVPSTGGR